MDFSIHMVTTEVKTFGNCIIVNVFCVAMINKVARFN